MQHLEGTLAPPADLKGEGFTMWLEQQIWGHRFHNDQTPWLLLLEALGVMAARARDAELTSIFPGLCDGTHESFRYKLHPRLVLRDIVFRDRHLDEVAAARNVSDEASWRNWLARVQPLSPTAPDYGYLRHRFTRFSGFRDAVHLLRSAEVDAHRKRRTTSRHFAPRGPDLLCADVGLRKDGKVDKDRRFFARGGELLFLMLNRSGHAGALEDLVRKRLLSESRWNALARAVQPDTGGTPVDFDGGYLPLARHTSYERLAEDWLALLSLHYLPDDSVPEPLMRLSALGVMLYVIERAAEILGEDPVPIPLDMMSSATVGVQRIAKDCYRRHRDITRRAVERIVDDFVASDAWAAAQAQANPLKSTGDLVEQRFGFRPKTAATTPDALADLLKQTAIGIHEGHLGRLAGFYAEQIGLAVTRRGVGRWYGASDSMLEALVFANVRAPMELEVFLDRLWQRYGMVVGTDVGRRVFETVNYGHLKANQLLFEERLRVLGLAERLSDDCAFVVNPFFKDEA